MFKMISFLDDYHIRYYQEGFRQCRPGWVNLSCPFCSTPESDPYLGINIDSGAVNCYQCEKHSQVSLIAKLLNISFSRAEEIRREYSTGEIYQVRKQKIKVIENKKELILPYGCKELNEKYRKYLIKRRFDPDLLIKDWNIVGTNYLGEYRGRIIAPIYKSNKLVSYQGRDITGKQIPKYKACPLDKEIIHHKHYLYGLWKTNRYSIIVVEGIMDVWKLGYGAVATFGIQWRREQALLLLPFTKISIMFDPEPQAQRQAEKLAKFLNVLGKKVKILDYEKYDPGDMTIKEGRQLMKYLL